MLSNEEKKILINKLIFDNISFHSLNNNKISNVIAFPYVKIRVLNLRQNLIDVIAPHAFKELTLLEELDLSSNKLTFDILKPNVFQGKYNPAEYQPLEHLKVLNLGNNHIHSLDSDIFEHMPALETLILTENPFTVIDHGTTVALSSITLLKVFLFLLNIKNEF